MNYLTKTFREFGLFGPCGRYGGQLLVSLGVLFCLIGLVAPDIAGARPFSVIVPTDIHVRTTGSGVTVNSWGYIVATTETLTADDFSEATLTLDEDNDDFSAAIFGFNNIFFYTPLESEELAGSSYSGNLVLDDFILPGEVVVAPTVEAWGLGINFTSGYIGTDIMDCSIRFGDYLVTYSVVVEFSDASPTYVVTDGQRLDAVFEPLIPAELLITGITDVGNDQGRQVRIAWQRSSHDEAGDPDLVTGYAVFRRQDEIMRAGLNDATAVSSGFDQSSLRLTGWDYLATVPAFGDEGYQTVAPTLCDSTIASGMCWSTFMIRAMTATPSVYFDSPPDSGYSVDNLAPGVPQDILAGYLAAGVTLDWEDAPEADFQFYRIYRGAEAEFVPSPGNLLHETAVSAWTDPTTNPWDYHYKITVLDYAGNEGEAGSPAEISGVRDGAVPARTALFGAVPNPFNPSTKMSFEIAAAGHVRLKVYDPAGRLVATLVDEHLDFGSHQVVWDGKDDAGRMSSAGVYLYRLEVQQYVETKRMTLVK